MALGLAERRTGILCLGAPSACSGRKRWEEQHPQVAEALRQLADAHAQQDPTFRTSLPSTRLTAKAALEALREQGYGLAPLPSPSNGRGVASDGLSVAQGGEGHTPQEEQRDRCHRRH